MTIQPDAPPALWQDGWYRFARRLASPNHGPRPAGAQVDLIVVHSISLPPGEYGGDQVQQLFTNTLDWNAHPYFKGIEGMTVSSHFYIRRGGELWQFVSCDERAWHAGASTLPRPRRLQRRLDRHRTRRARGRDVRSGAVRGTGRARRGARAALPGATRRRARAHRAGAQARSRRRLRLAAAAAQPGLATAVFPRIARTVRRPVRAVLRRNEPR